MEGQSQAPEPLKCKVWALTLFSYPYKPRPGLSIIQPSGEREPDYRKTGHGAGHNYESKIYLDKDICNLRKRPSLGLLLIVEKPLHQKPLTQEYVLPDPVVR